MYIYIYIGIHIYIYIQDIYRLMLLDDMNSIFICIIKYTMQNMLF